jgi:hypothetical protein
VVISLNSKQVVSFKELLMSQVVLQGALMRLLVEIGRTVDREMKRGWSSIILEGFVL